MSKNTTITIIVIILVIIGGYFLFSSEKAVAPSDSLTNTMPVPDTTNVPEKTVTNTGTVITYSAKGFSPSTVTINVGDTVTFRNESSLDMWPASAMHPTHTVYDGTSLQQHCVSGATASFDSCGGVAPGGTYSFTFTKIGSWGFHDHLNPKYFGKVIVQ